MDKSFKSLTKKEIEHLLPRLDDPSANERRIEVIEGMLAYGGRMPHAGDRDRVVALVGAACCLRTQADWWRSDLTAGERLAALGGRAH
jgi:hypothetical protein